MESDVVILGAGAAGIMCAIEAGKRNRKVILLDHSRKMGEKIRISGGGRCNFTNRNVSARNFISQNPHFCISALKRYTPKDFIEMIYQYDIRWHEKTLGQLFCNNSSRDILNMLSAELKKANVTLFLDCKVTEVKKIKQKFHILTSFGNISAYSLVIATGGKSIPKMGASAFGYQLAESFGHSIVPTKPALVPLTFGSKDLADISFMAGISIFSKVSCNNISFNESLLFTHRGLSGPSILQISSYWNEGDKISVDLHAEQKILDLLMTLRSEKGSLSIKNSLSRFMPSKVSELITRNHNLGGNLADQNNLAFKNISDAVHNWSLKPIGSEGYRTAEVTLGGVDTNQLDSKTMESKKMSKLYFIGEVVDVTGWLGGYNFQWAWSSGWVAGQVV